MNITKAGISMPQNEGADMKARIVELINQCRSEIVNGGFQANIGHINECVKTRLEIYSNVPQVRALLQTLEKGSLASGSLLDLTLSDDPNFILGFFDVPYNPDSFLEAASVRPVPIPPSILAMYPTSHAAPVLLNACTDGFKDPLAVAVFGENYIDAIPSEAHRAYYFIDKFVDRFKRYTRPRIEELWSPTSFSELLAADTDMLTQVNAIWVHMHEFHHRSGFLPLPKHLKEKSTRNGAGAEELRVDIFSILALSKLPSNDPIVRTTQEYILAERLIRYPLQASPESNYDARSSVALQSYLTRHGIISKRGGKLYFEGGFQRLLRALSSLAAKITALEYKLSSSPSIDKRQTLATVLPEIAKNNANWQAFSTAI